MYYVTIFYESVLTWLFLCFGFELVSQDSLTLDTFILLIITGIIIGIFLVVLRYLYLQQRMADTENPFKSFKSAAQYEKYFFRVFQLIETSFKDPQSSVMLQGLLANHIELCENPNCSCTITATKIAGYRVKEVENN